MHCKAEELALLVEHVKLVSPQFEHFLRRVSPFSVVVIIVQCDSTRKFHDLARVESVNIWKIVVERVSSPNESSKLVKNPQCVWARIPVRSPVAHWPLSSNLAYYFDGFLDVLFLFVRPLFRSPAHHAECGFYVLSFENAKHSPCPRVCVVVSLAHVEHPFRTKSIY